MPERNGPGLAEQAARDVPPCQPFEETAETGGDDVVTRLVHAYPWTCMAMAFAAGCWLAPRRREPEDAAKLADQEGSGTAQRHSVGRWLFRAAGQPLVQSAVALAAQRLFEGLWQGAFVRPQAPPPSNPEEPDFTIRPAPRM